MIRLFVGFDQREALAYHVFSQSVIDRTREPVSIVPLASRMFADASVESDGSNAFTLTRFLVPYLCDFTGWAIYADGDMLLRGDLAELWAEREGFAFDKAVAVVRHDYQTKHPRKYIGTPMEAPNGSYPCKNWSSLILWNCGHFANRQLMPEFVREKGGKFLHRFEWLKPAQVGALQPTWNHLVNENQFKHSDLYHYTLGVPGIGHYAEDLGAMPWHETLLRALECAGEKPQHVVNRAIRLKTRADAIR